MAVDPDPVGTLQIQTPRSAKGGNLLLCPTDMDVVPGGVNRDTGSAGRIGQSSGGSKGTGVQCHAGDGDGQRSALLATRPGWPSCTACACNQAFIPKARGLRERKSTGERRAAPTLQARCDPRVSGSARWWLRSRHSTKLLPNSSQQVLLSEPPGPPGAAGWILCPAPSRAGRAGASHSK